MTPGSSYHYGHLDHRYLLSAGPGARQLYREVVLLRSNSAEDVLRSEIGAGTSLSLPLGHSLRSSLQILVSFDILADSP